VYAGFAPASDQNDPELYARNVACWTGLDPDIPVKRQSLSAAASE
jgi:hypothetical protein